MKLGSGLSTGAALATLLVSYSTFAFLNGADTKIHSKVNSHESGRDTNSNSHNTDIKQTTTKIGSREAGRDGVFDSNNVVNSDTIKGDGNRTLNKTQMNFGQDFKGAQMNFSQSADLGVRDNTVIVGDVITGVAAPAVAK